MPMSRFLRGLPLALLLVALLINQFPLPMQTLPPGHAITRNILLRGDTSAWNFTSASPNPAIRVAQGDSIVMNLTNDDFSPHEFFVDVDGSNPPPNCPPDKCSGLIPSTPLLYSFDVDFPPGNYAYYCKFHTTSMRGRFIVEGFTVAPSPSQLRVIQGSSNTSTVSVRSINGFAGTVGLTALVSPTGPVASYNPASVVLTPNGTATSELTISTTGSTPLGTYSVSVRGNSSSSFSITNLALVVVAPDFSISANPTLLAIPLGSSATSTVTVTSLDSFSDVIDLSVGSLPVGVSAILTPATVILNSGGTATSNLNITIGATTAAQTYSITITGVSGPLTHTATITLVAGQDFGLSTNPGSIILARGTSGSSTVTISSFNGFAGSVDLASSAIPSGISAGLSPTSVNLSADSTNSSTLTLGTTSATPAVNYTVTINGVSGSRAHNATVVVDVIDFTISAVSSSLTLSDSETANVTITLTSLNRFSGSVNLASLSSSGLTHSLDSSIVTVEPGTPKTTVLRIGRGSSQDGAFTVMVTATEGGLSHSASISITVRTSPRTPDLSSILIITMVAGAVALVAVLVYVRSRKRPNA